MGRNNEKNIKKHNDKLHKAQQKDKDAVKLRKDRRTAILKEFNDKKKSENK